MLNKFKEVLADDLKQVDQRIGKEYKTSSSVFLDTLLAHIYQAKGKMVRPALAICIANLKGKPKNLQYLDIAAAVEILHTASLVHDDIVDKADLRRGVATVSSKWGIGEATLLGDWLLAKAFEIITKIENSKVIHRSSTLVIELSEGQFLEMEFNNKSDYSEAEYMRMIDLKTSSMFRTVCSYAALTTGDFSDDELQQLENFGSCFGHLFQITDDLIDILQDDTNAGKTTQNDLLNGLKTLPVIKGLELEKQLNQTKLLDAIQSKNQNFFDNELKSYLIELGAIQYCFEKIQEWANVAITSLDSFEDSQYKQLLTDVIEYVKSKTNS